MAANNGTSTILARRRCIAGNTSHRSIASRGKRTTNHRFHYSISSYPQHRLITGLGQHVGNKASQLLQVVNVSRSQRPPVAK